MNQSLGVCVPSGRSCRRRRRRLRRRQTKPIRELVKHFNETSFNNIDVRLTGGGNGGGEEKSQVITVRPNWASFFFSQIGLVFVIIGPLLRVVSTLLFGQIWVIFRVTAFYFGRLYKIAKSGTFGPFCKNWAIFTGSHYHRPN